MKIWDKIQKIDINVELLLSKQNDIFAKLEDHEQAIRDLRKSKHIIYGMALVISGILSILTAYFIQVIY